jgi:Fur family transcriptional regulator, zinc uptake regulator
MAFKSASDDPVLSLLRKRQRPLSAYDILAGVNDNKLRAATQVYRALAKLEHEGLVHRVESLNAFVACACAHEKSNPGFMLCTCCGTVREFDAAASLNAARRQDRDFRIETPNLELRGLCAKCQSPGHSPKQHRPRPQP